MINKEDTIVAIATAYGRAGVGMIRVSGPAVPFVAQYLLAGKLPKPRYATYAKFLDQDDEPIDQGIVVYFPKPHSFTGEDVLELHTHGGPIILDRLLKYILTMPVRHAQPGEFSLRAFLNGKIDLVQAEAIADLIDASSEQAAKSAMRTLQGEFSQRIHALVDKITVLRMYVEAVIDFPEEDIDFLADEKVAADLEEIMQQVIQIFKASRQGSLLRDGITIAIAGKPNVGKSTLLNRLSGQDSAIVSDIPGTTRDLLREHIQIDGVPMHIIDTAGLHDTTDTIEQEGMRRARQAIFAADCVLLLIDATDEQRSHQEICQTLLPDLLLNSSKQDELIIIKNKIDRTGQDALLDKQTGRTIIQLSAKTGEGVDLLRDYLKKCMGLNATQEQNQFIARRRHLTAITKAEQHLQQAQCQMQQRQGELLAEELRLAQQALCEITGEFSADDLLGKIFSNFCIGK